MTGYRLFALGQLQRTRPLHLLSGLDMTGSLVLKIGQAGSTRDASRMERLLSAVVGPKVIL
jgi:hypothetical protein